MKVLITVLFSCLMVTEAMGQIIRIDPRNSDQSLYSQFNAQSLQIPYSSQIPADFLFLVDDEIQKITFNPAYGYDAESAFVNGTFNVMGRSFNRSGLVPAKSGKWFYTLGVNVNTRGDMASLNRWIMSLRYSF
jgi:hypothetical protein